MKPTEFIEATSQLLIFTPTARLRELVVYMRTKDKGLFPSSPKGYNNHVEPIHAANLLYFIGCNANPRNISKYVVWRGDGMMEFINDLESLIDGESKEDVEKIFISTKSMYAEIHYGSFTKIYNPCHSSISGVSLTYFGGDFIRKYSGFCGVVQ
jgi:hypothetical protein